jgi:hypothetical protein
MHSATIVKDDKGHFHIRISKDGPQTGGKVKLIEILHQKDGESLDAFKERAVKFVQEEVD